MYLTRHELYEGIWNSSARQFAQENGLEYNRVLYACKRNHIPRPDQMYVANLKYHPERLKGYERPKLLGDPDEMLFIQGESDMNDISELVAATKAERVNRTVKEAKRKRRRDKATPGRNLQELIDDVTLDDVAAAIKQHEQTKPLPSNAATAQSGELLPAFAEDVQRSVEKDNEFLEAEQKRRRVETTISPQSAELSREELKKSPRYSILYFLPQEERMQVTYAAETITVSRTGPRHKAATQFLHVAKRWAVHKEAGKNLAPEFVKSVSPDSFGRIAALLSALFYTVESLGGIVNRDLSVSVLDQTLPLSFSESKGRIPHVPTEEELAALEAYEQLTEAEKKKKSAPKVKKWEMEYTGKLTLSIGTLYAVKDKAGVPLEDSLGDIIELLYTAAYQLATKEELEKSRTKKTTPQYQKELERMENLVQQAEDFDRAEKIRNLIEGVHEAVISGDISDANGFVDWAAWASAKADWLDPSIARKDDLLGQRHYPILERRTR